MHQVTSLLSVMINAQCSLNTGRDPVLQDQLELKLSYELTFSDTSFSLLESPTAVRIVFKSLTSHSRSLALVNTDSSSITTHSYYPSISHFTQNLYSCVCLAGTHGRLLMHQH